MVEKLHKQRLLFGYFYKKTYFCNVL